MPLAPQGSGGLGELLRLDAHSGLALVGSVRGQDAQGQLSCWASNGVEIRLDTLSKAGPSPSGLCSHFRAAQP